MLDHHILVRRMRSLAYSTHAIECWDSQRRSEVSVGAAARRDVDGVEDELGKLVPVDPAAEGVIQRDAIFEDERAADRGGAEATEGDALAGGVLDPGAGPAEELEPGLRSVGSNGIAVAFCSSSLWASPSRHALSALRWRSCVRSDAAGDGVPLYSKPFDGLHACADVTDVLPQKSTCSFRRAASGLVIMPV